MMLSLITLAVVPLLAASRYIPPPSTVLSHPTFTPPPKTLHRGGCQGPDCFPVPKGTDGDQPRRPSHPDHPQDNHTAAHPPRPFPFPGNTGPGPAMNTTTVPAPAYNATKATEASHQRRPEGDTDSVDGGRNTTGASKGPKKGKGRPNGGRRAVETMDAGRAPRGDGEGLGVGFWEYVGQGGGI